MSLTSITLPAAERYVGQDDKDGKKNICHVFDQYNITQSRNKLWSEWKRSIYIF